jgi:peptide/nickel transport system ATP-binding protein/oligopeptide transport system ATP-binding protein
MSAIVAPSSEKLPLLSVEHLVKHFQVGGRLFGRDGGKVKAVDGVDFTLRPGETLALVGESGCGKSTTGRLVLRLIEPDAGAVRFNGRDILGLSGGAMRALRREMQIVFQDPYASLNPRMTVGEMLAEPLAIHGLVARGARHDRVEELLRLVGLAPQHARRYPHEFSGGQRQRIGIARALAVEPKLLVCDEPVSALDVSVRAQVVNLLRDLQRRLGLSYIFIAHDLAVVKHIADRIAVMYLGKIVELARKETLFAEPRHPYTQALLSAIPLPEPHARRRRMILEGDVPSPLNVPPGCRFQTRCPYARERCRSEAPAFADDGRGHVTACHFWREIPPPSEILPRPEDEPPNPRLERLQAYFTQARNAGGAQ